MRLNLRWYQIKDKEICLAIKVKPNARKAIFQGVLDDRLQVAIPALPVAGAANKILVEFLAETFQVSKSQVKVTAGLNARYKRVSLPNTQTILAFIATL